MIGVAEKAEVWDPCQPDESVGLRSGGCMVDDELSLQLGLGLLMLLESSAYARILDEDPWEFSVEWPELQRIGLSCTEGRWLIHGGLVDHAHEVTSLEDRRRRFVVSPNLSLSRQSCLVLTEEGHTLAGASPTQLTTTSPMWQARLRWYTLSAEGEPVAPQRRRCDRRRGIPTGDNSGWVRTS